MKTLLATLALSLVSTQAFAIGAHEAEYGTGWCSYDNEINYNGDFSVISFNEPCGAKLEAIQLAEKTAALPGFAKSSADMVFGGTKTLAEVNDIVAATANKWEGVTGKGATIQFNNPGHYSFTWDDFRDKYVESRESLLAIAPDVHLKQQTNFIHQEPHYIVTNAKQQESFSKGLHVFAASTIWQYDDQQTANNDIVVNRDLFVQGKSGYDAAAYTAGAAALLIDKFNTRSGQTKNILIDTSWKSEGKNFLDLGRALSPIYHPTPGAPGSATADGLK